MMSSWTLFNCFKPLDSLITAHLLGGNSTENTNYNILCGAFWIARCMEINLIQHKSAHRPQIGDRPRFIPQHLSHPHTTVLRTHSSCLISQLVYGWYILKTNQTMILESILYVEGYRNIVPPDCCGREEEDVLKWSLQSSRNLCHYNIVPQSCKCCNLV